MIATPRLKDRAEPTPRKRKPLTPAKDLFVQIPKAIMRRKDIKFREKCVYSIIRDYWRIEAEAGKPDPKGWPSEETIAEELGGILVKTVTRAVAKLEKVGLIFCDRKYKEPTQYRFPEELPPDLKAKPAAQSLPSRLSPSEPVESILARLGVVKHGYGTLTVIPAETSSQGQISPTPRTKKSSKLDKLVPRLGQKSPSTDNKDRKQLQRTFTTTAKQPVVADNNLNKELLKKLKEKGVQGTTATELASNPNVTEDRISTCWTEAQKNGKDPVKLFIYLLRLKPQPETATTLAKKVNSQGLSTVCGEPLEGTIATVYTVKLTEENAKLPREWLKHLFIFKTKTDFETFSNCIGSTSLMNDCGIEPQWFKGRDIASFYNGGTETDTTEPTTNTGTGKTCTPAEAETSDLTTNGGSAKTCTPEQPKTSDPTHNVKGHNTCTPASTETYPDSKHNTTGCNTCTADDDETYHGDNKKRIEQLVGSCFL